MELLIWNMARMVIIEEIRKLSKVGRVRTATRLAIAQSDAFASLVKSVAIRPLKTIPKSKKLKKALFRCAKKAEKREKSY
jgi:hypothetical protein